MHSANCILYLTYFRIGEKAERRGRRFQRQSERSHGVEIRAREHDCKLLIVPHQLPLGPAIAQLPNFASLRQQRDQAERSKCEQSTEGRGWNKSRARQALAHSSQRKAQGANEEIRPLYCVILPSTVIYFRAKFVSIKFYNRSCQDSVRNYCLFYLVSSGSTISIHSRYCNSKHQVLQTLKRNVIIN